jgi:plastocyanin
MGHIHRHLATLAVVAVFATGCGDAGGRTQENATGATDDTAAADPAGEPCAPVRTDITLVALEAQTGEPPSFNRTCLAVPAGEPFMVTLRNKDFLEHNFSVFSDENLSELLFRGDRFRGPRETLVYDVPAIEEPGTYTFVCDVHLTLMRGKLEVH